MIEKSAAISDCGRFRWKLVRRWDLRPMLLAVMANPSQADAVRDDPTVSLLSYIASWNGFGALTVMNVVPFRSSDPEPAVSWARTENAATALVENRVRIGIEAAKAGIALIAWGAIGARFGEAVPMALAAMRAARPDLRLVCLGKTSEGWPIHPLARGKHKVPRDRTFVAWDAE